MSELGIIRSYLVSLGFDVSKSSFTQAQDSLNQIAKSIAGFSSSMQGIAAAAGVTATVAAIATAFEQLTLGVADATIKNQEFARQMWMGFDQAVAFKSSLDALHVSIQDLYLSPTLMNAFIQFRQLAQQMKTPADFQSTMDSLAQVTFQFDEFKLEASYAIQWVGYALAKDLAGPFGNFQDGLKKLNTWIITTMPNWTKKIADFIVKIVVVFKDIYDTGKSFVTWWDNLGAKWQHVIEISAGLIIGIMAIGKAISIVMGIAAGLADADLPLLAISAAILAIILLVQDYYTYSKSGQSALSGVWKAVTPYIKDLETAFSGLGNALLNLIQAVVTLAGGQGKLVNWGAVASKVFEGILALITTVVLTIESLVEGITIAVGLAQEALGTIEKNPKLVAQGAATVKQGETELKQTWLPEDQPAPKKPPGKASGGPASGLNVIGEHGPEIGYFPKGTQIFSNSVLTNMLNAFKNMASPQQGNKTSTITLSPVYYISGAGSPQQTADAIQGNNLSLIMRVQSGLIG
jgi:hypothetical protein